MLANLFLKGWMIGFSIAIPVGPIAMLCIRHSLIRGTGYGIAAGLGAALADTIYGALAGLGITAVCNFLTQHQLSCQLLGSFFLCYLGISSILAKPCEKPTEELVPMSFKRVFLTTFLLTLTNPLTFLGFLGIYAALGIGINDKVMSTLIVSAGVFIGSAAWWLILSSSTSLIGKKIHFHSTRLLNRISGSILLGFGLITGFAALQSIHIF